MNIVMRKYLSKGAEFSFLDAVHEEKSETYYCSRGEGCYLEETKVRNTFQNMTQNSVDITTGAFRK